MLDLLTVKQLSTDASKPVAAVVSLPYKATEAVWRWHCLVQRHYCILRANAHFCSVRHPDNTSQQLVNTLAYCAGFYKRLVPWRIAKGSQEQHAYQPGKQVECRGTVWQQIQADDRDRHVGPHNHLPPFRSGRCCYSSVMYSCQKIDRHRRCYTAGVQGQSTPTGSG